MISTNEFKAIAELDLDPIKVKLMHKESGEGWTLEHANSIEFEYRRFLYLVKIFPNELAAPLFDVDVFWHYHILDTMKYAVDCDTVFGYFLHHFPYAGLRDGEDELTHQSAGMRMQGLYEKTFLESYIRATTAADDNIAYSYHIGKDAIASAGNTAYSYAMPRDGATAASNIAYSYHVSRHAAVADGNTDPAAPIDVARLRRLYFERPVLAST